MDKRISRRRFVQTVVMGAVVCGGLALPSTATTSGAPLKGSRPNVILIMTDDQGYGDLACHGNPVIKTPHLDAFHAASTRLTRFQVSPTCSPTRAALLTGQHAFRSGVTHTYKERERMNLEATTVAEALVEAGYATGIFGKWHLGDEDAHQPYHRGFQEVFTHGGGGIGQSYNNSCGDVPDNQKKMYFDPVFRHNRTFVQTKGFCTDVIFTAALGWIKAQKSKGVPFFAFIPTNAPHGPMQCPDSYLQPYLDAGLDAKRTAPFYGMITNIDDNVGRLMAKIKAWGLAENTLVIFMTDNGTSGGAKVFNAGMRGQKGSAHEGGTRVPAFFQWPGRIKAGVDVDCLSAHIDLFPTLAELCIASIPGTQKPDGRSLLPLLEGDTGSWSDRYLFTHLGRWDFGKADGAKYRSCAVRSQRFRLVNHRQLFDMENDPRQKRNVAAEFPEVTKEMQQAYDQWWDEMRPLMINEETPMATEQPFAQAYLKQKAEHGVADWVEPQR